MCVAATTLSSVSTGLQIAGAVSGMFGSYKQASGQQDALNYQAAVARNNAQVAEWQAQTIERQSTIADWQAADAIERGRRAEEETRRKTSTIKGSQRARLAANGVALDEGSALNILTGTDVMGEIDALTVRDNAEREAWGYHNQKRTIQDQAWATRMQGAGYLSEAALRSSAAGAISLFGSAANTLLTAATPVAERWYRNRTTAVDPGNYQVGTQGYSGNFLEWDA